MKEESRNPTEACAIDIALHAGLDCPEVCTPTLTHTHSHTLTHTFYVWGMQVGISGQTLNAVFSPVDTFPDMSVSGMKSRFKLMQILHKYEMFDTAWVATGLFFILSIMVGDEDEFVQVTLFRLCNECCRN